MSSLSNKGHIAVLLASGILAQAIILQWQYQLKTSLAIQIFTGAACIAGIVAMLWQLRRQFHSHVDMLLIMTSFGGLGMEIACAVQGHASHLAGSDAWWRACFYMILAGFVPAYFLSRCLSVARASGTVAFTLLIDAAGMLAGMAAAGRTPMSHGSHPAMWLHHLSMLVAMLAGMTAGMLLRDLAIAYQKERRLRRNPARANTPAPEQASTALE